ncbi:hypothetical protein GMOD_00008832 [Pyrenophora seminiperda CCB06]|uniref:Uncharacterized protein n=1 Tax=Pyrenophora seminiperda CCB06 TaxID=1302712 RepID=A0A3M7M5X4_9PLEO|nr:hypothetical protein GMOD_00008832 [Pyrenophora seminiperda CCB06]
MNGITMSYFNNSHGYSRFTNLEESLFSNNEGDYASSYLYPDRATGELHRRPLAANPPPWEDPVEAWRYDGDRVWTGEAFVLSRRTQLGPETRVAVVSKAIGSLPRSEGAHLPESASTRIHGDTPKVPAASDDASNGSRAPSEFQLTEWDDEAKRKLYMWKAKKRKGYRFFLHLFPGETEDSLRAAWQQYKKEAEKLFREWEAADDKH